MNKEKSDFTQGSILKKLIPFMIPILGRRCSRSHQTNLCTSGNGS